MKKNSKTRESLDGKEQLEQMSVVYELWQLWALWTEHVTVLFSWLLLPSQLAAVLSHICRLNVVFLFVDMARGQQKIQSQQKNAKKQAEQKKKQGHDQKAAAKAALIYTCTVCRVRGTEDKLL